MMWILMCCIALFVGFMLYSSIEDKVPELLSLAKLGPKSSTVVPSAQPPNQAPLEGVVFSSQAWQIRGDGVNAELTRDFQGSIEFNGQRFDAPALILTCYEGEVFARVNMRMAIATSGSKATVGTPTGSQQWSLGQGNEVYSPTPKVILAAVGQEKSFKLTLPYAEIGSQTVTFTPKDGKRAIAALPAACH